MGQLVRHRRSEKGRREVRVHVCLRRKGEEKAGKVRQAQQPGKEKRLCRHRRARQFAAAALGLAIDGPGLLKHGLPVTGADALRIPRHAGRIAVCKLCKIRRHALKLFSRDGPGLEARARHKVIAVIEHAPQDAEARIDREDQTADAHDEQAEGPQALSLPDQTQDGAPQLEQDEGRRQQDQQLGNRERHPVRQHGKPPVQRPYKVGRKPPHERGVPSQRALQHDDAQRQQADEAASRCIL